MGLRDVSNDQGRKGQPCWQARCNCCDRKDVFSSPRGDEGRARKKIQEKGWSRIKGVLRCPKCEAKRKVERMPQKVKDPAPLRQPTREQNFQIGEVLRDVYDRQAGCYKGSETDDTVADVLGVMPGWVVAVREEAFGASGANEDMSALSGQVASFLKEARALVADRDRETDKVVAMIKRVEAIEKTETAIKKAVGPRIMARVK